MLQNAKKNAPKLCWHQGELSVHLQHQFVARSFILTPPKSQQAFVSFCLKYHFVHSTLPWCCNHQRSSRTLICFLGPLLISRDCQSQIGSLHVIVYQVIPSLDHFVPSCLPWWCDHRSSKNSEMPSVWSGNGGVTWELIGKSYTAIWVLGARSKSYTTIWL